MEGDETISRSIQLLSKDNSSFLKTEYIDHAKYIIDTYLNLNSNQDCEKLSKCSILEIGIQFWIAEKLPIDTLENFFIEKLDYIFYDIAYLLFW